MSSAVLCMALILDFPSQKNYTPLHLAALSKKHLVAQLLIGHGADVTVIGGLVRLLLFVCLFVCLFVIFTQLFVRFFVRNEANAHWSNLSILIGLYDFKAWLLRQRK